MNYVASNQRNTFRPIGEEQPNHVTLAKLLAGYGELVADLGGNAEALLAQAGLTPADLRDPLAPIPVHAIGQLLGDSAAGLGCPDFGLRLAERQSPEAIMQPLDRLFQTAPTVRDAVESCSRHVGAFNSGLVMDVAVQDLHAEEFDDDEFGDAQQGNLVMVDFKLLNGLSLFPQFMEQLLLLTHKCILGLSAGFARSRMILFSHLRIGPPVAYARRFNTIIRFGQEYDAILFGEGDLATRIAGSDAQLFACEAQLAAERFPARDRDIEARVRQAVFRALTHSEECSRHNIAALLGFQERTLNRHLFKKGTSFEAIRDEVRRNLAYRYLARQDLSLSDIAGRLGYSELAVLSRCCQRWFGLAPSQLRQNLLTARTRPDSAEPLDGGWSAHARRWPQKGPRGSHQPVASV